jgi:hypothetical protein
MISSNKTLSASTSSKQILFIHHSTGANLIREGHLRKEITQLDPTRQLWDHNYNLLPVCTKFLACHSNYKGLSDASGSITGKDYAITLSNNSPKEYAEIFSRNRNDVTLRAILKYDIIAFKNCYPTTKIISQKQLTDDKFDYITIRGSLKKYSENKFILITPPPIRKNLTTIIYAQRAQTLIEWIISPNYLKGVNNIHIFDFFHLLADNNGFLKKEYQRLIPWDSHPNKLANETIAPIFAQFLVEI